MLTLPRFFSDEPQLADWFTGKLETFEAEMAGTAFQILDAAASAQRQARTRAEWTALGRFHANQVRTVWGPHADAFFVQWTSQLERALAAVNEAAEAAPRSLQELKRRGQSATRAERARRTRLLRELGRRPRPGVLLQDGPLLQEETPKPGEWPKKKMPVGGADTDIDKDGDTFKVKFLPDGPTVTIDKVVKADVAGGGKVRASDSKGDGSGTKTPGGVHFGYWKVFQLAEAPGGCTSSKRVQLKRVVLEQVTPDGGTPVVTQPKPGKAPAWELDGPKSADDPSSIGTIPGEPMTLDAPGWVYPKDKKFPPGEFKRETNYRTWFICCKPFKILGYFEWTVKLTVQIKPKAADSTATVDPTGPEWHDHDATTEAGKDFDTLVVKKFPKLCA
ncbi:MAG: hypothetical protein HY071_02220 [Chloroflexi bacterium]|nr:hypothetical protein [Chloroflexota bacterium]